MDSLSSSSSSEEECDSRVGLSSNSQPVQCFLMQPNSSQALFNDPISNFLLQQNPMLTSPHLPVSAESNGLFTDGSDPSGSLSDPKLAFDPVFVRALMMNSQSDHHQHIPFTSQSLESNAGSPFRNSASLCMENARPQGSAGSVPAGQSIKSNKPTGSKRRKRTRASRRAPTTVMTTDTTNFRAMVQEFTGIPTTSDVSSHLHRAGIGILGPSKLGLANKMEPQHPYSRLFRPFSPKAKSAGAYNLDDLSPSPAQFTLPSDLGLLNFHTSFSNQAQAPMNRAEKYPVLARTIDNGGDGVNKPSVNHSALMVNFANDHEAQHNNINPGI